jgi:hypothetical protein
MSYTGLAQPSTERKAQLLVGRQMRQCLSWSTCKLLSGLLIAQRAFGLSLQLHRWKRLPGLVIHIILELPTQAIQPVPERCNSELSTICLSCVHACMHFAHRMQHGEALCPLCLPSYNAAAFMHAYLHYLPSGDLQASSTSQQPHQAAVASGQPGGGVYIALLAPSSDDFHALSRAREALEHRLQETGVLQRLHGLIAPYGGARLRVDNLPPSAGVCV